MFNSPLRNRGSSDAEIIRSTGENWRLKNWIHCVYTIMLWTEARNCVIQSQTFNWWEQTDHELRSKPSKLPSVWGHPAFRITYRIGLFLTGAELLISYLIILIPVEDNKLQNKLNKGDKSCWTEETLPVKQYYKGASEKAKRGQF